MGDRPAMIENLIQRYWTSWWNKDEETCKVILKALQTVLTKEDTFFRKVNLEE